MHLTRKNSSPKKKRNLSIDYIYKRNTILKLDILALAAHPDDVELCCGATIAKHIALGYKVGVVDFTRGELGTRGTPEIRVQEAEKASEIMGLSVRENLGFRDGFFEKDEIHLKKVIGMIRKYRPDTILINAENDRHPDHGRAHELSKEACFLSGLHKIETLADGLKQEAWRPKNVYSYIQGWFMTPDFVVDVTDHWEIKMNAIRAFRSQFHDPNSQEPATWLSSEGFIKLIEGRGIEMGQAIGCSYGEGFKVLRWPGVNDITKLL